MLHAYTSYLWRLHSATSYTVLGSFSQSSHIWHSTTCFTSILKISLVFHYWVPQHKLLYLEFFLGYLFYSAFSTCYACTLIFSISCRLLFWAVSSCWFSETFHIWRFHFKLVGCQNGNSYIWQLSAMYLTCQMFHNKEQIQNYQIYKEKIKIKNTKIQTE